MASRSWVVCLMMVAPLRLQLAVASVLSSSRLQSCVNNGSGSPGCEQKMVVTMTLEHGQRETESAQFLIREVRDESEAPRQLQKPWRISWRKSPAHWRYSLRYVQDVNNKPFERVIELGWFQCKDNPLRPSHELSCGVATLGGVRVPDSEGFCCPCTFGDIVGGVPTRGDLDCGVFNVEESAHCLMFDELWYSIYEVERPQVFYDITVAIARPDDPSAPWSRATFYETNLRLSHQDPVAEVEQGALRVELVGDLATATAPHRFESRYLVIPSRPLGHPRVTVPQAPLANAMLVDRSLFELSGRSCDKIGVSFTAFKRQAQQCERPRGSCLASQLEDLHQQDTETRQSGQRSQYHVSGFCEGALEFGQHTGSASASRWFLACPLQQRHTTMLRLEVRANDAMFVTNVATGRIVNVTAQAFQALQGGTEVVITLVSTGRVVADFTVGVSNCSDGLTPGPALKVSLKPLESTLQRIRLFANQQAGGRPNCLVKLYSALHDVLDQRTVRVNVSALEFSRGAQVPVERPDGDDSPATPLDGGTCATICKGFINVFCFVSHSCWTKLLATTGVTAGSLLLIGVCFYAIKAGLLGKLVACLC